MSDSIDYSTLVCAVTTSIVLAHGIIAMIESFVKFIDLLLPINTA